MLKQAFRATGLVFLGLLMLFTASWGVLALHYFDHANRSLCAGLATAFALVSLAALRGFTLPRWRWRALAAYLLLFLVLLWRWNAIEPSNDRDWQPEVAILPYATVDGDRVTVHRIRNFDYRSEADFTPAYYDKTFDLRQLESVDLIASYWMGPAIAHTFLTFGFTGGDHLAVSIETRKERNEIYSSVAGFFRQYELFYVVANERDVIRVRTNYRRDPAEDVYLYRLKVPTENARRMFLGYMDKINSLTQRPEFYKTLTTNCTTNIWMHSRVNPDHPPFTLAMLASGHVPKLLYEAGRLDTSVPFAELQRRSRINARAQAANKSKDFSRLIRLQEVAAAR